MSSEAAEVLGEGGGQEGSGQITYDLCEDKL